MAKVSSPDPVQNLRLVAREDASVTLQGSGFTVRIAALAADLLRLRVVRAKKLPQTPSWAVLPWEGPAPKVQIRTGRQRISLGTDIGTFSMSLSGGAWEVTDSHGLTLFAAAAGATSFSKQSASLSLNLQEGESLFGLGEATGAFDRRGLIRDFWNIDVLGHAPAILPALKQLYVSIPFALSLRHGRAAGLFWDNPARQLWDLGQTHLDRWQMSADSGELDLYLFLGPAVSDVVSRYTQLTGQMPMPPRWGLGYQQCRYSYETADRVRGIAREFRKRKLPCDVLYLDIHHMDGYRVFTFGKTFPKPKALMKELAREGFKVVTIVDPGVKNDRRFSVLQRGLKEDAFVKHPQGGGDFLGKVWPGVARFPDFLNERTRSWWGREQAALQDLGVAGFWNDMNEPANFARPDKTLHPSARHRTDFGPRRHGEVHNLYGMQMARASQEGALKHRPDERPFIITRAGYAGIQRHALVWTGDNSSNWDHLNDAVQMLLNLSLSGVPFCGGDVGGFLESTTPELFVRWLQFATFTPFFRNHTNLGTIAQEPWALGTEVEEISRRFLQLRYQLLPYLYGRFAEARDHGTPIMRPLLWHYQNDPVAVTCGDQFLLGRDLLVAPILRQGARARSVYLPNDVWYDFWTGERHVGGAHIVAAAPLETIPLFVRAGAILPMVETRQHVDQKPDSTVLLQCWPGAPGRLSWYEDDGRSNEYLSGAVHRRTLSSQTRGHSFRLEISGAHGGFPSAVTNWRLVLREVRKATRFSVDGRKAGGSWIEDTGLFVADIPNHPGPISVEFSSVDSVR
ncbi:MAG: glycoside hydrolase family 31 protein [Verrucomicrobiota bacterium]